MSKIQFINVGLKIPIINSKNSSLKKRVMEFAIKGKFTKNFDGHLSVQTLKNINLTFNDGERVGLVGRNGSGKTTLLRVISGIYPPTTGKIICDGKVTSLLSLSLGINNEMTGRQNIFLRGALIGIKKKEIEQKINEIIDFSELNNYIDLPVRTYSSGMNLRLAFTLSTVVRPEILLMDEWLSVGDQSFKRKAEERLLNIVKTTKILVIASHSENLIRKICNRAIWIDEGKIIMDNTVEKVCDNYFGNS